MTTDLARAVARALDSTEAVVAPAASDLATQAMTRYRRRARRRVLAGTGGAFAAVLALALGAAALKPSPGRLYVPPPPATRAGPSASGPAIPHLDLTAALAAAQPAEKVWPEAVRRLPAKLPNGVKYHVIADLGRGEYVVQETAGFEHNGSVARYSPATGRVTMLLDQTRISRNGPVDRAWVVGGHVAVQTSDGIWTARLSGGTVSGPIQGVRDRVDVFDWVGDRLVWNGVDGIYAGDHPAAPIAGSNGYGLVGTDGWAARVTDTAVEWWNLTTGERHRVPTDRLGGRGGPVYGTWDLVTLSGGSRTEFSVITPDGLRSTATLTADAWGLGPAGSHAKLLSLGSDGGPTYLWDLRTGKVGLVMAHTDGMVLAGSGWDTQPLPDAAGGIVVLNLSALGT